MILLADISIASCIGGFLAGAAIAYLAVRWKEQRAATSQLKQALQAVETAHAEAEMLVREARLRANEESLQIRAESEKPIVAKMKSLSEAETRLVERESLISRQLENIVAQEKSARITAEAVQQRAGELENKQKEIEAAVAQARQKLASIAGLSETEAREQLLRELQQEAEADAGAISRHIVEEAKVRA